MNVHVPGHQVSLVHPERENFPGNYAGVEGVASRKLFDFDEAAGVDGVDARSRSDLVDSL